MEQSAQSPSAPKVEPRAVREAIGQQLRRYYQMECVRPTPARLQMLLDELMRRAGSDRADAAGSRATSR
jgi:hypothetical protein